MHANSQKTVLLSKKAKKNEYFYSFFIDILAAYPGHGQALVKCR